MTYPLVLVHSPSVGPSTWAPAARYLQARGVDAVVPDLTHIGAGGPPYWPRVAGTVADAVGRLDEPGPVVLVVHSNAGLFVPTMAAALPRAVAGVVFVDAALPAAQGDTPVADAELLSRLQALADADGLLPRWTDWWSAADVAALLPDPAVRAVIVADQPRLPLDYYAQTLPVPDGWWFVPGAYLQFTAAYDAEAVRARSLGWPVEHIIGEHLHQVVEPVRVATAILDLSDTLGR